MKKSLFILVIIPLGIAGILLFALPILTWLRSVLPGFPEWVFWLWLLLSILFTSVSLPIPGRLRSILHAYGELINAPLQTLSPFIAAAWVLRLILPGLPVREVGLVMLALYVPLLLFGVWNALHIHRTEYVITLPKLEKPLRAALISDLHLGFFTGRHLTERILAAVDGLHPDLVLIAGDIVDDRIEALRHREEILAPLRELTRRFPVLACPGNHDGFVKDSPARDAFLREAGIRLRRDETVTEQGLCIVLRRDFRDKASLPPEELLRDTPRDLPLVVVDHNPGRVEGLWANGAELVLSGHTHGGQTFPGTLFYKLTPDFPYGHRERSGHHLIVTSGIGSFGLPIRIGVSNEAVLLRLEPEKTE